MELASTYRQLIKLNIDGNGLKGTQPCEGYENVRFIGMHPKAIEDACRYKSCGHLHQILNKHEVRGILFGSPHCRTPAVGERENSYTSVHLIHQT